MVLVPLLIVWMRKPMYFNQPSRWSLLLVAVAIAILSPRLFSRCPMADRVIAAETRSPSVVNSEGPFRGSSHHNAAPQEQRLREGTQFSSTIGRFGQRDGAWIFQVEKTELERIYRESTTGREPKGGDMKRPLQLLALENLALQRVVQTLRQDPTDSRWAITGVITEYFGENRVLITAAVRAPIQNEQD